MMRLPRLRALLALVLLALVAGACGQAGPTTIVSSPRMEDVPSDASAEGIGPASPDEEAELVDGAATGGEGDETEPATAEEDDDGSASADSADTGFKLGPLGSTDSSGTTDGSVAGTLSASFLRDAAAATESTSSYRYEVLFSMYLSDGSFEMDVSPDSPMAFGAASGSAQWMAMDLGVMFDEMFAAFDGAGEADLVAELFGDDLTMETIIDGSTMYIRAPFLAQMASGPAAAEMPPAFGELQRLAGGWGVIDLERLDAFGAGDLAGLTGMQGGSSPDELLALLRDTGAELTEVGPAMVRGVATTHVVSELNIARLMQAQGVDASTLGLDLSELDFGMPFDVFVDQQNRVRRITMSISTDALRSLSAEDLPPGTVFEFSTTVDLFDFGEDIAIEAPAASAIVGDFTELFADLAALGL